MERAILWRRLDLPGHEAARLLGGGDGWRLEGTAVLGHGGHACRLDYRVACDAAWLRFPGFALEPLPQVYRRTGERAYRYESAGGAFARDLAVDGAGFVTLYPGLWEEERPGG